MGGGIGMGNTCKSMADSCQCMAKTTIIKKKRMLHKWNHILCYLLRMTFFFPLSIISLRSIQIVLCISRLVTFII